MKKHTFAQAITEVVAQQKDCRRICPFKSNKRHSVAQHLKIFMAFLTFLVIGFASCSATEPTGNDKLPFGVFPLNDVKWVYNTGSYYSTSIYDSIQKVNIAQIDWSVYYTQTYSVRQIAENKAELHFLNVAEATRTKMDLLYGGITNLDDTTWTTSKLQGIITIEDKKVFYQDCYVDENGEIVIGGLVPLLYDFGLQLNDTILLEAFDWSCKYSINTIDSVLVDNEYRKRYNFVFKEGYGNNGLRESFSVVEGIGCDEEHILYPIYMGLFRFNSAGLTGVYYKDRKIYPMGGK